MPPENEEDGSPKNMPSKNVRYKIAPLSRVILYKMYISHVDDEPTDRLSVDAIAQLFTVHVSKNLIKSALDLLRESKCVTRSSIAGDLKSFRYTINRRGIEVIEGALSTPTTDLYYFDAEGDRALEELAGPENTWMTTNERIESEPWEPLDIDRNDPNYIRAVQDVSAAIEVTRGDSGYADSRPEERAGILISLETGLDWLKNKAISRSTIQSLLIKPFQFLASQFSHAIVGEAAKTALAAIFKWLVSL